MGLDVRRETEKGEQEDEVLDSDNILPGLLNRCRDREWRLIQYIDPYGDTVFNQLQIPRLLEELHSLMPLAESESERKLLSAVLDLVGRTRNEAHTYIKFYGD